MAVQEGRTIMIKVRRFIFITLVVFFFLPSVTAAIQLPRTGQDAAYIGYDDGYIRAGVPWPAPRFTRNWDGTVTDNLTGLMWLQSGWCIKDSTFYNYLPWREAVEAVELLNRDPTSFVDCYPSYTATYSDWRLPNANELLSLIPYFNRHPVWDFLERSGYIYNIQETEYWTSTGGSSAALTVEMLNGYVVSFDKSERHLALPVRGPDLGRIGPAWVWRTGQTASYLPRDDGNLKIGAPWSVPRFIDHGDGTVTDRLTKLMWLKDWNCMETNYPDYSRAGWGRVAWIPALEFVNAINRLVYSQCSAGYTDWRVPNAIELRSLVDYSKYGGGSTSGALPDGHPFINFPFYGGTWSSTCANAIPMCERVWVFWPLYGWMAQRNMRDRENCVVPVRTCLPYYRYYLLEATVESKSGKSCPSLKNGILGKGTFTLYFQEEGDWRLNWWGTLSFDKEVNPEEYERATFHWPKGGNGPSEDATIYLSYETEIEAFPNTQVQKVCQPAFNQPPNPPPNPPPPDPQPPQPQPPQPRIFTVWAFDRDYPKFNGEPPLIELQLSESNRRVKLYLFSQECPETPAGKIYLEIINSY